MNGRPIYEGEADRQREAHLAEFVRNALRATEIQRTPKYYPCDWVLRFGDGTYGLLELKIRDRFYLNYMLSLHKASNLITYAEVGRFMPILAVAWMDTKEVGIWAPLERTHMQPGFGGRRDRGDLEDVEPVVMVSSRFCQRFGFL